MSGSKRVSHPRLLPSVPLPHKAWEHRSVAIIPAAEAAGMNVAAVAGTLGAGYQYQTRSCVTAMVERKEMRWCDRHHNTATYTDKAAGQWQKTPSGGVCTMQLVIGAKGRYVPIAQRE